MFNKELFDVISGPDVDARKYACGQDFSMFFVYYMSEYLKYPFAPFHYRINLRRSW